jgi:purine nucleosidase/non-specific riboncleoside hydrolase
MASRKLLVDTDGGTDDALALALLAANGRAPDYVTTVFGNVPLAQATTNILATLAVLDIHAPVHAGADRPLLGARIDAEDVHGEDGLGGAPRPAKIASIVSNNGVGFLMDTLRAAIHANQPIDILALGPLTNLALAFRTEPRLIAGIGTLTIMGGTSRGRGNMTGAAEFNILADPEAAGIVLSEPIDTVLVPWEPCVDVTITGTELDALFARAKPGARRDFLKALIDQLRKVSIAYGAGDNFAPPDPLAAAVLIDRSIAVGIIRAGVAVECGGTFARGATILDLPGRWNLPAIATVDIVDAPRFKALFEQSIEWLCERG